jgi:hypothetical protein
MVAIGVSEWTSVHDGLQKIEKYKKLPICARRYVQSNKTTNSLTYVAMTHSSAQTALASTVFAHGVQGHPDVLLGNEVGRHCRIPARS